MYDDTDKNVFCDDKEGERKRKHDAKSVCCCWLWKRFLIQPTGSCDCSYTRAGVSEEKEPVEYKRKDTEKVTYS